ncbi:MAG: hypothetical protein ACE5FG_03350 [Myxococcota bacterium]
MKAALYGAVMVLLLSPSLAGADYFRYETENGTLAFTDDEKRIPSRYREAATQEREQPLDSYARLSVVSHEAWTRRATSPDASATALASADTRVAVEAPERTEPPLRIQIGTRPASTTIELPAQQQGPVRLARYTEWRWVDGRYVPHAIVEQDGHVISIVRLR